MSKHQIENTIPVLPVRDLEASIQFYADALGFELEWNAGSICSVAKDGCSIMLLRQLDGSTATVWIGLEDDQIFSQLRGNSAVIQPPTKSPWAYEMKLADPDGNIVWLGTDPA